MEMFITIICGIIVFVFCEYIKEIWLIPLQDYRKLKQRISYALTYYANLYNNTIILKDSSENQIAKYTDASNKIRDLACELRAFIEILTLIKIGIPSNNKLFEASSEMIGLSNRFYFSSNTEINENIENYKKADKIRKLLKIVYSKKKYIFKSNKQK